MVFRILPLGQQRHAGGDEAETADNAGFVLRIHAIGQHSTPAIHEELQWLLAIRRETALIVPAPVPAHDGSLIQEIPAPGEPTPRQCVLFHWVPGDFRHDTLTPNDLQGVGVFMAQLHCHADQFVAAHPPPPTRRALFCDVHAWMDAPGTAAAHFSAEELAVFAAAAQRVHTTVQELGESQDVFGFIHADLHQWNYVFHGEEVRAIDFDDCGWGYYTYDMAVTLSYLEDWGTFPALQDAFLTGYQRVRPLPRRYAAALPRTVKSGVPVKLFRVGHLTLMRTPVVKRQRSLRADCAHCFRWGSAERRPSLATCSVFIAVGWCPNVAAPHPAGGAHPGAPDRGTW